MLARSDDKLEIKGGLKYRFGQLDEQDHDTFIESGLV